MARPRPPKRPHGPARTGPRLPQGLPDRATLLAFIRESGEADRSDIARAFGLKGADRIALRDMLRDLQDNGDLGRRGRRSLALPGQLPPVGVVEVIERDADGRPSRKIRRSRTTFTTYQLHQLERAFDVLRAGGVLQAGEIVLPLFVDRAGVGKELLVEVFDERGVTAEKT